MPLQWRGKAGWCNRSDILIFTLLKDFWCALGIILLGKSVSLEQNM